MTQLFWSKVSFKFYTGGCWRAEPRLAMLIEREFHIG